MARYFFHDEDGKRQLDEEGIELPDNDAARIEASRLMGEMLRDRAADFWDHRALKLLVTDRPGHLLFVLELSGVSAPAVDNQPWLPLGSPDTTHKVVQLPQRPPLGPIRG